MDFSTFNLKEMAAVGATYHLRSYLDKTPLFDEDGTPVTFTLLGKDSREFRKAFAKNAAKKQGKAPKQGVLSEDEIIKALDDSEGANAEIIAGVVIGTTGVQWDGKPVKTDQKQLVQLFTQHPWILEQLDAFLADREAFFAATGKK
jgi:hypothetical protein